MKKGKTELVVILDRSGSMSSIKSDIVGGLKTLLEKQRKEKGECYLTLYQFDDTIERIYDNVNIDNVTEIDLIPRGMTRLNDAIGTALNEVGARLAKTREKDRPESVIVVTLTDGLENASKEFDGAQIKKMVKHQEDKYSWRFIYLGANQDAVLVGKSKGFTPALSMTYNANSASVRNAFSAISDGVSTMRSCVHDAYAFSDEQRKESVL